MLSGDNGRRPGHRRASESEMKPRWKEVRLGSLIELRNGINFTQASRGRRVKVVGVGDFQNREVLSEFETTGTTVIDGDLQPDDLLADNDLLFVRSNGNKALVGRCVILRNVTEPITFSGFTIRARVKDSALDPAFLSKLVRSDLFQRHLHYFGSGSSINNLSQDALALFAFQLPPVEEQRRIATILRTWDEAIEKLISLHAAKSQRRDGVAQYLLAAAQSIGASGKAGWKRSTFGAVFTERHDRNCGLGSEAVVTVGKYAIRKQSEHFTRSVASSDLSNYWTISPGDFVYDPMSAYYGAIGRYAGDSDGIVSPAYRVTRLSNTVVPAFMVHLLKSHRVKFLLETRSSQGNKEGKRRLLQRDEFADVDFLLPPMEEQCRIAKILATFKDDLDRTAILTEAVTRQKRGLMQKLLSGDWRVRA